MEVVTAKSAGFCFGVRRAVEKALAVASESDGTIYTDGPLIHNPGMLAELERSGVVATDDPESLPEGAVLLVRAHGIPPERRRWLKSLPVRLVDATCPEVARIQGLIRARVAQGREILILGDEGHAEVVGLLGHAQGHGHVVRDAAAVESLPAPPLAVTLVSQTTQDAQAFEAVAEAVRTRYPGAEILDTVCAATKSRQGELRELAGRVDAMVVVGSPTSANTVRLAEIASRQCPSFLVRGPEDINPADFTGVRVVGLSAGASTPDATIEAVQQRLLSLDGTAAAEEGT